MRRLNEIVSGRSEFRQADSAGKFQATAWAADYANSLRTLRPKSLAVFRARIGFWIEGQVLPQRP